MAKTESNSTVKGKQKKTFLIKKAYVAIVVCLLFLAGGGYLGYDRYNDLKKDNLRLQDPQEAAKDETERIKSEVASLIDVPSDEAPTIASVVDASKLSKQAFFAKAQNGDRVLMYAQAKKAILYRPSTKKIIEVAPINIGNNSQPQQDPAAPAPEQQTPPPTTP